MSLVFAEIRCAFAVPFQSVVYSLFYHSAQLAVSVFFRFVCPSVNSLYANPEDTGYFPSSNSVLCLMLSECLRNTMTTKQLVERILMTCLT